MKILLFSYQNIFIEILAFKKYTYNFYKYVHHIYNFYKHISLAFFMYIFIYVSLLRNLTIFHT